MKKTRLSHRILAMVLVVLMTVQLLPLSAFAAFGNLQSWDPGVDLSTLKQEDAINWPIKVYDYLSDGMLFEWMDTNTTTGTNGSSTQLTVGHTDGTSYIAPYGGGYKPPATALGSDFTYAASSNYSTTLLNSPYYWYGNNGYSYGKAYTFNKVDADDYKTPYYLHITDGSSSSYHNMLLNYFDEDQSPTGNIRYMVMVYRASGVEDNYFSISCSSSTSANFIRKQTTLPDSSDWRYIVFDLSALGHVNTNTQYVWLTWHPSTAYSSGGMASGAYVDLTHVGYFSDLDAANNYGAEAVKFDKNPGEYLAHSSTTTYTHSYVTPASRSDYLNNIFSLNYCWKNKDTTPKMFSTESNAANVRYGLDFTTHSTANGWKTNAYTSNTFWTWSNGTALSLKYTTNKGTRTDSFSMSKINVEQKTQSNGAQYVTLTTTGPSNILLSKFREDHQQVQEGYVPLTADVDYMVMVYRANGWTSTDKYGLWAQGYLDSSSPDSHKTANYWKYAGLTKNSNWTQADNINQLSLIADAGWQYVLVPIAATIGAKDSNMTYIDRLANLGLYLPELSNGKSLDIAYVGYFKNNPNASDGAQFDTAHAFGAAAVNYMNAKPTVTQDVNESKTYANSRRWYGGGNKSFGMLYSSGGGQYWPTSNSGGDSSSTNQYDYGYEFDTWMIGYRTNAKSGDSFNAARYNLVYNSSTGLYEKSKFTANYTGTTSGYDNIDFISNPTGTTNNIYFVAATEEDANWGSNDGDDTNGKDFDFTNVPFDGYQLLQTMTSGVMTAGLLEGSLQTVMVNGVKYRVPVYRQETVEYIAYNLLYGLRVPMKDSSGNYNTRYIKGTESTKFGGVDLNGDGVIGWINYDGDSRNGNELNEASVDLATALRHELGLTPRLGNSINVMATSSGVDTTYATFIQQMGNYNETLAKSQMLFGEFSDCRNAIDTAMDAAYYLLNNIFISESYNQEQNDYDYLTLSSATVNALGHSGYAYVFDAGFTTGKTATYDTTFTDDGTNKSAIKYSPYGSEGGTGTISMEGVTGKTRFDYGQSSISWTTRFPFLPITDAEGDFAGQTQSYYFLDDAQRVYTEGSNSYKDRNFNYVIASNGEFVYREEDNLFFEFEGDDDVYLFINGELVLDIGGAHSITSIYIDVNDYVNAAATALKGLEQYGYHKDMSIEQFDEWISAANLQYLDADLQPTGESVTNPFTADQIATYKRQHRLNLSNGQICQFDFYYMERHGWGANMRIVTNMHITDPALTVDKSAHQFGEEIEYGGVIDPTSSVEYNFKLVNTGNTKLYNLTWRDDTLGITMDPTNGLVVGNNPDGIAMNGTYVMNKSGGYLQAKDLSVRVTGKSSDGVETDFIVTFEEENGDGGQGALRRFLAKLDSDDGTQSGYDDAEVTNAGSGLWVGGSVQFMGIYYMLTPEQTEAGKVDNTVYLTATTKTDPAMVGNHTLRSDDSHRLYTNGFPIHYQWAGHEIFMNMEHLLTEAKEEAERDGSQLSLYQEFFKNVTLDKLITVPCDKLGRVGGDYSDFLTKYSDEAGHSGYLINYKKPGVYTFYLLMYMNGGKDTDGNTITASGTYNATDIADTYYAVLRSQVFVADVEDSVYVLDYGLSTESLDANGLLFKDDYLFGPNGLIRAKLMGITGGVDSEGNELEPSFRYPSEQTDATKTGIYFTALDTNRIYTANGFYNSNLAIPSTGKDIAYDSNKDEYTLTGVGTTTIKVNLPVHTDEETVDPWATPYLYYWYDDGTTGPAWPGSPLKKNESGYWEADIPADVANVIVNNGSAALKTNDLQITPGLETTITVTVSNTNVVSTQIETIMEEVTMHVKVPEDWGTVYLHHWHDNGESTEFPGDEITEVDENGYYTIKLHGNVSNLLIANGDGKQTGDLSVFAGKEAWITVSDTVTGTATDDAGNVTTTYYSASVKYTLDSSFVVRASVPASWGEKIYMYYWREDGSENATWPGEEMIKGDMWYTCKTNVPADVSHIVITDGDKQTLNLTVTPGLETWIMVQNETQEHQGKQKYTAKIAYGSEGSSTGLTFTPTDFLDQENNMWLAITVHGANSAHSGLNEDIDIHNEVQMYKKITVLPATVVYYEDTFGAVDYNKDDADSENVFDHHGNGTGQLSQSIDQDQPYGQDSTYQGAENDLYSGNSLTEVTVMDDSLVTSFDFKGTGFEIVGRTNAADSASFMVRVYEKSAYSATAYDTYLEKAWEYLDEITKYNDVYTGYTAAGEAYNNAKNAYTAAVTALDAAKEAYKSATAADATEEAIAAYAEKLAAAQTAFDAYAKACENYSGCATAYETALKTYKNSTDAIAVVSNIGSCSYKTSEELVDPATLFTIGEAPTAPQAPEIFATMVKPTEPTAPFIIATSVYTQFDHGNNGGAESINQVPVIRVEDLDRLDDNGDPIEYMVEIAGIPMYNFDADNNYEIIDVKPTKLYIDGIRIFQPMGDTNAAYSDKENGATVEEIRDMIANGTIGVGILDGSGLSVSAGTTTWTESMADNDFDPSNKETFHTIKVGSTADYLIQGPNNEVYMEGNASNSALIFYVKPVSGASTHELQIAARALDYGRYYGAGSTALSVQLQYGILTDDGYAWKNLVHVVSGTEQYYSIPYDECPMDTQGRYQIILRAINPQTSANAMVSYTSLKLNGLEVVKVDGVGEGSVIYYENGILVKPYYEMVIIEDSSFTPVDSHKFNGSELTLTLDTDNFYFYITSTQGGVESEFYPLTDPGQVTSATMWKYVEDSGVTRYTFDVLNKKDSEVTFTIKQTAEDHIEVSYCVHTYGEGVVTREPNCSIVGIKTYTCTKCDHLKQEFLDTNDKHSYSGGICSYCGAQEPKFYLVGYINGANYGYEEDYTNMGEYLFVDGKLRAKFDKVSYVFLKADGNKAWYMTPAYATTDTATFYDTTTGNYTEKMHVQAGIEYEFTLVVNDDGSLTLSYAEPCVHNWTNPFVTWEPTCTTDGERTYTCSKCFEMKTELIPATGHSYVNGVCSCGDIEYRTIYFQNTDNWENVYLYAWYADGLQYTSKWPGDLMEAVEGEDGVYSVTIPSALKIIFNNGDDAQTENLDISADADMFVWSTKTWVNHSGEVDYYLVGTINGVDYGIGDNRNNMGAYKFVDGKLIATFTQDSYVMIKTTGNSDWYASREAVDGYFREETLDNTKTYADASEKLMVPGDMELEFTLVVNEDDTVTLTVHSWSSVVPTQPTCTEDGQRVYTCILCNDGYTEAVPALGHSFDDNHNCTVCGAEETRIVYFHNTAGWENVYIYAWIEGGDEYTGAWPGTQMSLVEGETDLYYYELSAKAKGLIFNNGSGGTGNQTDDLTAPTGENNKYTYGANVWTTLDTEVELPEVEYLYLDPGGWDVDSAWFAAYFFGSGNTWVKMTDTNGDGIYECQIPDGYTSVIFCRMNKADTALLDWSNKWNQTVDLTLDLTNNGNQFTITGPWDGDGQGATGTWSTYVAPVCEHGYTEEVTTAAGCETAGVKTFTCTKCGDSYTQEIAATGHSYSEEVTTAAGCETTGVKTFTCSTCSDSYTEEIAATGHSYVDGTCSNCGASEPAAVSKVYLQPGSDWRSSDAWFAAWFPGAETWVTMTDNYGNGYYECEIPDGATAVIFVRMNPTATAPSWNDGEKWNQTVDLTLEADKLFVIENPWNSEYESKATGSWTDYDATVAECQHSYTESVTTAATCTTAGLKTYTCSKCSNSYTEEIAATGHNFVDGTCANGCGTAEPTEPVVLYLSPNTNWQTDSPWYAAYFFGNGETWVAMTDSDSDGIYEVEAPTGYPSVIFCRMNPSATTTGWDNVWNQTNDLTVPADEKVLYTVAEGAWSKGDGAWSALTTTATLSLRSTRSITRAMSAASEEQTVVLPEIYISGDEDTAMNLSSINAQMSSDVVFGDMDIFVAPEEEVVVNIDSAAPVLSDDIRLNFYVTVPENAENVYMTFTFNGKMTTVTNIQTNSEGGKYFTFAGINPQTMGDSINATLYATVDGVQYIDRVEDYSIVKYCTRMLDRTTDTDLITLISDLLVYGAKTQIVQNYKTDALVTDGLELNPSTFPGLDASFNKLSVQGQADPNVGYSAVSLVLSGKMTLCLTVKTNYPAAYTYKVSVAGVERVYTAEDLVPAGDGKYYLYFDELKATCFDEAIVASIMCGDETVGGVVTYSVNTYVQRMQNTSDSAMRELLEAIYNYGNSARTVANRQG